MQSSPLSSAHKGLVRFVMESNILAYCSNTTAYVGVSIFALCGHVGVLIVLRLPVESDI